MYTKDTQNLLRDYLYVARQVEMQKLDLITVKDLLLRYVPFHKNEEEWAKDLKPVIDVIDNAVRDLDQQRKKIYSINIIPQEYRNAEAVNEFYIIIDRELNIGINEPGGAIEIYNKLKETNPIDVWSDREELIDNRLRDILYASVHIIIHLVKGEDYAGINQIKQHIKYAMSDNYYLQMFKNRHWKTIVDIENAQSA